MTAAAGLGQFSQLYSGAVVTFQFRIWFGYLCSGLDRSRFSQVVGLVSHVFHYWGEGLFVPAATVGFAMGIRRICADRDCIANTADDGEKTEPCRSISNMVRYPTTA